jgi:hypothetical protein
VSQIKKKIIKVINIPIRILLENSVLFPKSDIDCYTYIFGLPEVISKFFTHAQIIIFILFVLGNDRL